MSDDVEQLKAQLAAAEDRLREAQEQLLRLGKMAALGTLVAGVAHDINTPLGSIKANAELAQRLLERIAKDLPPEPKLARSRTALDDALRTTLMAVDRIAVIARSLRDFARRDPSELEEADIHAGLDSSLQLCGHLFKNRIEVHKDYAELPSLRCRAGELNQVFMNLLTNAAQAIENQGNVTVKTWVDGDRIGISIADDGCGIDEATKKKLFDSGFTTKGVDVGTGLGLSIAHRIVTAHGGTISADGAPGQGATFTVLLPRHEPHRGEKR